MSIWVRLASGIMAIADLIGEALSAEPEEEEVEVVYHLYSFDPGCVEAGEQEREIWPGE
ncbi:MAG: hypothetical protein MUF49_03515 [Oculatellaceae cyanobacterium Prado106]|nr:hypothetical protein [Oculatellaceae cyanobacterium Prado106]